MLILKWLCSLGSDDLNQYLPVKQPLSLHPVKVLTWGLWPWLSLIADLPPLLS